MKKSEKKMIIENFEEKCDCREDDNCGCSFPNNTRPEPEAEAVGETKGSNITNHKEADFTVLPLYSQPPPVVQ